MFGTTAVDKLPFFEVGFAVVASVMAGHGEAAIDAVLGVWVAVTCMLLVADEAGVGVGVCKDKIKMSEAPSDNENDDDKVEGKVAVTSSGKV